MVVADVGGAVNLEGNAAYRERYAGAFAKFPNNKAELLNRIVLGNIVIDHVFSSIGDDNIAIKSGAIDSPGPDRPSTNISITDCTFESGHGLSIGSEIAGGVQHVAPDRLRIVLDPTRLRIGLRKLALDAGEQPSRCVEEETPRRSRSLIDREKMAHASVS